MEKLERVTSTAIPLPIADVDTDQIIPARFLKATSREGFGENLFRDWRYTTDGQPKEDFVLNQTKYSGTVLVAGHNFGCGSSREHAAWALYDAGFRVVVSSGFADIFKGNALNNGLLPVQVTPEELATITAKVTEAPDTVISVDVAAQTLTVEGVGLTVGFDINPHKKHCLLNGFDDTDFLISIRDEIEAFEEQNHLLKLELWAS